MFEFFALPFIVGGAVMLGMNGRGWSDQSKMEKIFKNCGLTVKEGNQIKKMRLYRKTKFEWGTEYAYKIPLGLSFPLVQRNIHAIEDGLNNKRNGIQKQIEIDYDGMLIIRVFDKPFPDLIKLDESLIKSSGKWEMPIGFNRKQMLYLNFDKIPHMIVAGTTQYGKTSFLKSLITTLISNHPECIHLTLLDLKGGLSFNRFSNLSQVESVASNIDESIQTLRQIKKAIEMRQRYFKQKGYESIHDSKIPLRHFIIIDEAAELAKKGYKGIEYKKRQECEELMSHIARVGGGLGYRLIFATQYPTHDTLPRQIKQNADSKLCFRLQTQKASEVVLDEGGAEELPFIKGRAIYMTDHPETVQTPYIDNEMIDRILQPYKVVNRHEHHTDEQETGRKDIVEFR